MEKEHWLAEYSSRDGQHIKLSYEIVRKYLISGKPEYVNDQEIMLYVATCKARGLNPFKKDCYLVKYTQTDPAATIVSIEYYRSRAGAMPSCRGYKSGIIVFDSQGQLKYRSGAFIMEDETLVGGWFRAKPAGWDEEYEWTISLRPYIKTTRDGQPTRFWQNENQPYMIAKIAESQGLRRLWPDEFQGLFVAEEIIDTTSSETPKKGKRAELPEVPHKIHESQRKKLYAACMAKGIDEAAQARLLSLYDYKSNHDIMSDKYEELMKFVENYIPQKPERESGEDDDDDIPDYPVP